MKKTIYVFIGVAILTACNLHAEDTPFPSREKLYHESLRPQFHFTARYWDDYQLNPPNHHEGWLNDINGLVYNDGQYHLFAQRWWSAWLHAVSTDLIHWKELRPAFGKGGRFGGTQSGGGVVDLHNCSGLGDGKEPPMIAFWSSTDNESQCISYSLDKGLTWTKYENNPVLVHKYRDPKVFWYEPDQKWIMVLYGPADEPLLRCRYGFNGEENDAHDIREFTPGRWNSTAIRLFGNGKVVVTDQNGQSEAAIDIDKQKIGNEVFCVGAKANGSEFFTGDIAEILVFNRPLSDQETNRTLTNLQSKWGLKESENRGVPTEGLVLRLDASAITADQKEYLASWKDISGHNRQVSQPAADSRPKYILEALSGNPVVRFEGNQFLQGPGVLAEGDDTFTIVALWRRAKNDGSQTVCEQNTKLTKDGCRASLLTVCNQESENVYLLFSSTNLLDWEKLDGYIPDSYECPDMFELAIEGESGATKWVVIDGNGDYVIGSFDGERFTPEAKKGKGDYGRNFYATMSFQNMPKLDPRRVQLAWMRGWDDYPKNMPFNQQVTFPCELTLRRLPQGLVLCRYPIGEIQTLYNEKYELEHITVESGENPLAHLRGELFDIDVVIDISQSTCSEIALDVNGNIVNYDLNRKVLSSVGSEVQLEPKDGMVEIRILVDRLSIETFGNGGEASITNIAYQKRREIPLKLSAVDGQARIVDLTVAGLESMWR